MTMNRFDGINWREFYSKDVLLLVLPSDDKEEVIRELTDNRCRTDNGLKPLDDAEFCDRLREATEPIFIRHAHGITRIELFSLPTDKIVRLRRMLWCKTKEEV